MYGLDGNEVLIAKQGGIEQVIQAMKLHPNHAGVQEYACATLWSLASDGEFGNSDSPFHSFQLKMCLHECVF
jgi:hypothetical protein